jgi:hypothetical protein
MRLSAGFNLGIGLGSGESVVAFSRFISELLTFPPRLTRAADFLWSVFSTVQGCGKRRLFDHLVGTGEQWRRHVEAERLGGSQIDDEIEFGRLLYRQISRFGTSQYPVNIRDNWPTEIGSTKLDKNEADKRRL